MRRRSMHLAIVLASAAVLNVAIAWLLAALVEVPMYPRTVARAWTASDGRVWTSAEVRLIGITDIWWDSADASYPDMPADQQLARSIESHERLTRERSEVRALLTAPLVGSLAGGASPAPIQVGSDTAYGLPLPCLWFAVHADARGNTIFNERLVGGALLDGSASARIRSFRALPLIPFWPGLLINTLCWTLLLWFLTQAACAARRRLRTRRGLCPWCAYPVGSAPNCAECGAALD